MRSLIHHFKNRKHKPIRLNYLLYHFSRQLIPNALLQATYSRFMETIKHYSLEDILYRVEYYNRLTKTDCTSLPPMSMLQFMFQKTYMYYYFDLYQYTRYFSKDLNIAYAFGDVTYIPAEPSIVKSRPIAGDNKNSVLLRLDDIRHFIFTKDSTPYTKKKDMLVFRGTVNQPHRFDFLYKYHKHPLCNIAMINRTQEHSALRKPRMCIDEQLQYKFILSLEGNDVASNLKWIMSSNSVAVMPTPKYETWFMEGTLKPDYHYIHIADDYSNLEEKLTYYREHPEKVQEIIHNANTYVNQFRDRKKEKLISLLVLEKYFICTGQEHLLQNPITYTRTSTI